MMNALDCRRDSYASWSLAVAALREKRVRSGRYTPVNDSERRQAVEGPREPAQLDAVRYPAEGGQS